MHRRKFITAAATLPAATLAAPSIARAQTTFNWKMTNAYLGSSFKCNTQSPLGIGCCDGHTKQAPQQRGTWRDISRA
jgi:hypothetical protein